jgi:hypothetical protein
MPSPLTIPQFFQHYNQAEQALVAAWAETDPERQHTLALLGQGFATLAQVDAIWLSAQFKK